jgi:hypothetical protein
MEWSSLQCRFKRDAVSLVIPDLIGDPVPFFPGFPLEFIPHSMRGGMTKGKYLFGFTL